MKLQFRGFFPPLGLVLGLLAVKVEVLSKRCQDVPTKLFKEQPDIFPASLMKETCVLIQSTALLDALLCANALFIFSPARLAAAECENGPGGAVS